MIRPPSRILAAVVKGGVRAVKRPPFSSQSHNNSQFPKGELSASLTKYSSPNERRRRRRPRCLKRRCRPPTRAEASAAAAPSAPSLKRYLTQRAPLGNFLAPPGFVSRTPFYPPPHTHLLHRRPSRGGSLPRAAAMTAAGKHFRQQQERRMRCARLRQPQRGQP